MLPSIRPSCIISAYSRILPFTSRIQSSIVLTNSSRCLLGETSSNELTIILLATLPASYPPIPSATAQSPALELDITESSFISRTIPALVSMALCHLTGLLTVISVIYLFHSLEQFQSIGLLPSPLLPLSIHHGRHTANWR